MADLDIQIDVPDDDDLNSPVRVLNGSWVPPWLKAVVVLLAGALLALGIGAFLLGRSQAADDAEVLVPPTVRTTPLASAAASPNIEISLEAVEDWEAFAQTGDLASVERSFDTNGPQYALFAQASNGESTPELDFAARNLTESTEGVVTTVSLDLVVSSPDGEEIFPYDFVYLDGRQQVWTVVDRRAPGSAALPPAAEMIDSARQNWALFTSSLSVGDGDGVMEVVSSETATLADQVAAALGGATIPDDERVIDDPDLFDLLVDRAGSVPTDGPGEIVIALLDAGQRQALVVGELSSWTQTDPDRIIASLEVAGQPVAIVPFLASAEGWTFDLAGALNTSGGSP
ncbi:MAG: hypothetical protein OEV40_18480 [Acidimicrobiia bacterium]|nr:hypothetical protein [Acidimicrobiia bacterium]